jgi:tetratricopeptide (TPR) repeat protein
MRIASPTWIGIWAQLILVLTCIALPQKAHAQYGNYSTYNDLPPDSTIIFLDSAKAVAATTPAQAIPLLNRALEAAIVNRNHNGEARAYLALADVQQMLGHANDAIESLAKCKSLFGDFVGGIEPVTNTTNSTPFSNSTYGNNRLQLSGNGMDRTILLEATIALTAALEDANRHEAAYAETEAWLQLQSIAPGKSSQGDILRTQARLKSKMGKNLEATKRFQQLIDSEEKANDQAGLCETLIEQGKHFQRSGDPKKAKEPLKRAIDIAQKNQYKALNIRAADDLAAIYKAEGDLNKELELRNSVLTISGGGTNGTNFNYLQTIAIGNAYLAANQIDSAAQYVQYGVGQLTDNEPKVTTTTIVAHTQTNQPNSTELQIGADAYRQIAEGYLKKSNLDKSLEYYKKYAVLQDSVKVVHARELAEAIERSKNFGKNEERVQLLERERDLSDISIQLLQQDQANKSSQIFTRNLIIGVLIACLLLAVLGGFILTRNTRARRRADKLLALQSMTGQMNPHFIFNALNSVNEYISQNDERAANRYLTSFSRLMRKVMDDSKNTFIPLTDEIDMLKLYLELEHARFKDQFEYEFLVDESLETAEFQLPPMIVQPYIENAIWHGLRYRKGDGHLFIHFQRKDDALAITIADNGIGIAQSKAIKTTQQKRQHSMGMKNIGTRMSLMNEIYASGMTVDLTETHADTEYPGTTVHIMIPQLPKTEVCRICP